MGPARMMETTLRQLFTTRRESQFRTASQDAVWADTLNWRANDYDFHRLLSQLYHHLDSHYRQEFGLRLDQLADQDELFTAGRRAASWYEQAAPEYRNACIFDYLYHDLNCLLSKRARRAFDQRQKLAKNLAIARNEV